MSCALDDAEALQLAEQLERFAPTIDRDALMRSLTAEIAPGAKFSTDTITPGSEGVISEDLKPKLKSSYILDAEGFFAQAHDALSTSKSVGGYVLGVQFPWTFRAIRAYGLARKRHDGERRWTESVPMHIASSSKFITAVALHRVLTRAEVDLDVPASRFLPRYWKIHHSFAGVTIRQLLTHESGISGMGAGPFSFLGAKQSVVDGVDPNDVGKTSYKNSNYTLLRLVLAVVSGRVSAELLATPFLAEGLRDQVWDMCTRAVYEDLCREVVFRPIDAAARMHRRPGSALAYPNVAADEAGFDSGNMPWVGAGAVGWQLTMLEWLNVLRGIYDETIVSTAERIRLLDNFLFSNPWSTNIGGTGYKTFAATGFWAEGGSASIQRAERNAFMLSTTGHSVAAFVNSRNPIELENIVSRAFHENLSLA
jgi:hypothetical protein